MHCFSFFYQNLKICLNHVECLIDQMIETVSVSKNQRTISIPTTNNGSVTNVMIAINNIKLSQPQLSTVAVTQNHTNMPSQTTSSPTPIGGPLGQEMSSPAIAPDSSPPDFDFNLPCRYFKSSFARSLSLNSGASASVNQSKSMDYIGKNSLTSPPPLPLPPPVVNRKCSTDTLHANNEGSSMCRRNSEIAVPPIPARRQNIETSAIIPTSSVVNSSSHLLKNVYSNNGNMNSASNRISSIGGGGGGGGIGNGNGNTNGGQSARLSHVSNNGGNGNSNNHFVRRNVGWSPSSTLLTVSSASSPSTGGRLSSGEQEPQLHDEMEPELKTNGEYLENRFDIVDPSTNVEAVILQNQVDTLQWQLKQADTSCGMYRAVMEEVARFLERYQNNYACNRNNDQISRSKSMYHVYSDQDKGSDSGNSSVYQRARSSTNLIDLKRMSPSSCGGDSTKSGEEDHYDLASPINTYKTFKDFTWRRSPKKRPELKFDDDAEEKLNKEAFRLSRTIHNLLHTQQPDLTQHRQSLKSRAKPMPNENIMPPDTTVHQKTTNLTTEMLFLRTMNMRDSRLSLRSSTDSSVHSTSSSSKVETDEENYSPPPLLSKQCANLCSTTEDESGFSSISSFQEIGVPLSSTMISSSSASSSQLDDSIDQSDNISNLDSRNSTLKAGVQAASMHANNVGLPLGHDVSRWDSKTYRKNKFQRFSTLSNEDSSTVLWV